MAIFRIFAQNDTFITNYLKDNVAQTGSNFGASEILYLFKQTAITSSLSSSLARILMKFDFSGIAALTASNQAPASGISYRLFLRDARHAQTKPASYDVEIFQLSRSWDEGNGQDLDTFLDAGYANWMKAKSNVSWTAPGGDIISSPSVTTHFDTGHEDLNVDITPIVNSWLTGSRTNNGLLIRVSSSQEADSSDYYIKMFHSRVTHFPDRRPYIEAAWDDSRRDDRDNFVFDNTGSLFLYNIVRGQLTNIPTVGTNKLLVRITDKSGTLTTVTASHTGITGIYSASFAIATGSYSGSVFNDIWFSGSRTYTTGTFYPTDDFSVQSVPVGPYFVSFPNIKNTYRADETVRFNMFVRRRDYNPAVVLTASSDASGLVVTKAYYRIDNDRTREIVVPFGTGSVETTRLSYGGKGNYFDFFMSSLSENELYRIVLLFDVDGKRQVIDGNWKFRVMP